ncbi:MAG: hypothetical protein FWE67_15295, partial [Planctomycetaceae bacterium]|nr:hypothetical protein [Planctomycetaceae bacterium]
DIAGITRQDKDRALRDAGIFLRQIRPNQATPAIIRESRELLEKIGAIKIDRSAPENYEQAKEFADEDWRAFALAFSEFQAVSGADKDKAKKQLEALGKACIASFNKAVNMREDDTPQTDINALRQQLVSVYWFQGKILEAALLADYLVQHHSNFPNSDKTAVQAVRLYRQVFVEDKVAGHDPSAVAARLDNLCNFILKRWEGQPEITGEIQLLQIETAIDNGDIEAAKKLLAETVEGTPQRVSAELKIGQSLWTRYAMLNKLPEGSDEKPEAKELEALLADTKKYLETGLKGKVDLIKSGKIKPDASCVQSASALAQIYTNAGQSEEAINWLKSPQAGPLTLLANPPATVPIEILKALQLGALMCELRAYVGIAKLEEAEKTMNELERVIKEQAKEGEGAAEEQRLTMIYVALGRQLEDRLKELMTAGKDEEAKKVAEGFKSFLERIKERGDSNTFQSLYWVADTFYRLGSGMTTDKNVPEEAHGYYRAAAQTYVDILKRIAADTEEEEEEETAAKEGDKPKEEDSAKEESPAERKSWAPEKAAGTINIRLAESLRSIGMYEPAMRYLKTVLEDSENRIDLQIEAAKNLEQWGTKAKTEEDKKNLSRAVTGIPHEKVWGWNGLIKRTSTNIDKFAPFYYEAYLSKFRCFIELGRSEKDKEKKAKYLDTAERDLITLIQMRPQLGGQDWYPLFDSMYKQLERAREKGPVGGLKGLFARIGEQQAEAEKQTETGVKTDTVAAAEIPDDEVVEKAGKKKGAKKKKDEGTDATIYLAIGVVGIAIPVVIFLVTRKKKKH